MERRRFERRSKHPVGQYVLAKKEADAEPKRTDDGKSHCDLRKREAEVAAKACILHQRAQRAHDVREWRQQARIDETETARDLPQCCKRRDKDEQNEASDPPRHLQAPLKINALRRAGTRC